MTNERTNQFSRLAKDERMTVRASETLISDAPGHPGSASRHSLRSLNLPRSLQVEDNHDRPIAVLRHGRRLFVEKVQERWRIDDEWWRRPISRLYYQVLVAGGEVVTIFKDLETGEWYQQQY
jgi:hypothetical protein